MPKLIIWDLDGTIVNSLPTTLNAFNDGIFPYVGRRLTAQEWMAHFGPSEAQIIAKIVGPDKAEECYARVLLATTERLREIEIFPGVLDTMQALTNRGHTMAIFTGRGKRSTDLILEHHGLRPRFMDVVTGTCVENAKPHPEGILRICNSTGIDPRDTVMIGDSPMDIHAGKAAGALTVGCVWDMLSRRERLEQAKAAHIIRDARALLELVAD